LLLVGRVIFAPGKFDCLVSVGGIAVGESILFIDLGLEEPFLGFLDGLQNEGLSVFSLVDSDSEEDLLGVDVCEEVVDESEDGVGGSALEFFPKGRGSLVHLLVLILYIISVLNLN